MVHKRIPKETEFQRALIDACVEVGGYGDKLQDKYVKGKCDVWLSLPSKGIVFIEVKLNTFVKDNIRLEFTIPQLEYMGQLYQHEVPVLGLSFATREIDLETAFYFKICPFLLLKKKWEENNGISFEFNLTEYIYYRKMTSIVKALDDYYLKNFLKWAPK